MLDDAVSGAGASAHVSWAEVEPSSRRRALSRIEHGDRSPESFVLDLLNRIEASQSAATVMFYLRDGTPVGELLTYPGSVCLAALREGQLPLGARLAARAPEQADAIKQALLEAKASGRRLGEVLIEIGAVSRAHVREAILDQIVDGIVEIARAATGGLIESTIAIEPQRPSSPSSAFDALEVYFRALRALLALGPNKDDAAVYFYQSHEGSGSLGALVVRRDVPVVAKVCGGWVSSLREIDEVGRAIEQLSRSPALIAAGIEPAFKLFKTRTDSFLCLATADHVALIGGLSNEQRARALAQAIALTS